MKISIITATYNSEATVRDTFESVLSQSYKDIEYIVVDGGSKDKTLDIIKEYEPKFEGRMKWKSEPDKGIYDAMNKGIQRATGDVVGILNSDDFYIGDKVIETVVNCFISTGCQSVCGNLYFVDPHNTDKIVRTWKGSKYKKNSFSNGWHPAHPTFFIQRDCYVNYGCFDLNLDVSADFELMLRMIEKHGVSVEYIDCFFVKMRDGGESTGSLKKIIQGNRNIMLAFKKNNIKVSSLYPIKRILPKVIDKIKHLI